MTQALDVTPVQTSPSGARKVREIVFHLGLPKTGTTAIQYALASKRYDVQDIELCYPTRLNHLALANALLVEEQKDKADERFAAVAEQIRTADADIAVISAELFEMVEPAALKVMIDRHFAPLETSIRMIAYVRPHIDRVLAAHTERTKAGRTLVDLDTFFRNVRGRKEFFYAPLLGKWRREFGSALTVRPFLRNELSGGDVVRDFFEFVVGAERLRSVEPQTGNESLSVEHLALLREFHLRTQDCPILGPVRPTIGWHLAITLSRNPVESHTRRQIDVDLATKIAEWYAADADQLDAEFLPKPVMRQTLDAGVSKALATPQSVVAAEIFDPDELARTHAWIDFTAELIRMAPKKFVSHFRNIEESLMVGKG